MNFAKKLLLGSFIAISSFALVACGGDSSSGSDDTPEQNNQPGKIEIPTQKDAIIKVLGLESREAGTGLIRFKGTFSLDFADTTSQNADALRFIGLELKVGKGNDITQMDSVPVTIQSNQIVFPTQNSIDLNSQTSAGVTINLNDPGFTDCGVFSLVVIVKANDGQKDFGTTEIIPFTRDPGLYCKAPESSSAAVVKTEYNMTPCVVEGLSTSMKPGIKIADCTPTDAASGDIVFTKTGTKDDPEMAASGNGGIVFVELTNSKDNNFDDDYDNSYWPEEINARSAYASDFRLSTFEKVTLPSMLENYGTIYVAKNPAAYNAETGAGMYPFAIVNYKPGDNGNVEFSVKLYKAAQ